MNETIRLLREKKGFSQTYLASYLKVSRQMYIKYETGEVEPPVHIIKDLCSLYSVSYDVIIDNRLSAKKDLYDIKDKPGCKVSDSSPKFAVKNLQLEKIISQIKKLPQKNLPAVSAYILLLIQEEKVAKKIKPATKSKEEIFKLAGKISIDENEIKKLREESIV